MSSTATPRRTAIALTIPVITLVLAATVIPVELRPLGTVSFGWSLKSDDVLENIAAFVAVGIVFGRLGFLKATILGTLISTFAETSQLVMAHRDPSVTDILSNAMGTMIGAAMAGRWKLLRPQLRVGKWMAAAAALMSVLVIAGVWGSSGDAFNDRGKASPGTLEGYWKFDESGGRKVLDSSGHNLQGAFCNQPARVAGMRGEALSLDGTEEGVAFAHSTAFRLTGSMAISAWIRSSSFPRDDAAIVSQLKNGQGYQLDTTVDKGPRTIGFKLTNSCGDFVARYGATKLVTGRWYHVAGVYDAAAKTMDVYLNGELDNGPMVGTITGGQRSSRSGLYIGRRADLGGFAFDGSIDEVHLYSFALTKAEVAAEMRGEVIRNSARVSEGSRLGSVDPICGVSSDDEDARLPGMAAMLGVVAAIAYLGLSRSGSRVACLAMAFLGGSMLLLLMPPSVPPLARYLMPVISLTGGASVVISIRH